MLETILWPVLLRRGASARVFRRGGRHERSTSRRNRYFLTVRWQSQIYPCRNGALTLHSVAASVTPGRFRGNARPISMLSYASVRACQCGEAYSHSSKRAVTVASELPRSGLGRHDGGANATVALPTCHRVGEPLTVRSWYAVQWVMKELRRMPATASKNPMRCTPSGQCLPPRLVR